MPLILLGKPEVLGSNASDPQLLDEIPGRATFIMKEINLEHLISILEGLPAEEWREEENQYITYVNLTKIHQPAYRDISGYYIIIIKKEKPIPLKFGDVIVSYLENFTLKVLKDDQEVFSAPRFYEMRFKITPDKMLPK